MKVCVFCGSSTGARLLYRQAAIALGRALALNRVALVYGGSDLGLMGAVAQSVLDGAGEVIGVIPEHLHAKVSHPALTELHVVGSMHERKARMFELADAFIALPGGLGTLEEIFEMLTWSQLGLHAKPCGLLNTDHYYSRLLDFLDHAVNEHFIRPEHRARILVDDQPERLLMLCSAMIADSLARQP